MGNQNISVNVTPTDEEARQNVDQLMNIQHELTFKEIQPLITKLLIKIGMDWPQREDQLSRPLVRIFLHPFYRDKMIKLYKLLTELLKQIIGHKTLLFVSRDTWRQAKYIAEFLLLFTDERLRKIMNTLPERIRKGQFNQSLSLELDGEKPDVPNIFESFSKQQLREDIRIFRDLIYFSLKLKENPIGRSAVANTIIYGMIQPVFSIYLRLFLHTDPQDSETLKQYHSEDNFKKNITSCTYIIGYSLEHSKVSTIQLAMIMIQNIMKNHNQEEEKNNIQQIPSHAFNKLPMMACSNIFQQIITLLLYGLVQLVKVQKQGEKPYLTHKHTFSRIKAIKLMIDMIQKYKPKNHESLFYLNILCRQSGVKKLQKFQQLVLTDTYVRTSKTTTNAITKYLKKYRKQGSQNQSQLQSTTSNVMSKIKSYELDGFDPYFIHGQISKIMKNPITEYEAFNEKLIYEIHCNVYFSDDPTQKLIWPIINPLFANMSSSRGKELSVEEYESDEEGQKCEKVEKRSQGKMIKEEKYADGTRSQLFQAEQKE